ncbi:hypothetical protein TNIN_181081 [Trichonephila inaurata madagascariensis]|uniref:Uncharacterized protein n=1 Tax=Trichonephila inaurata madagascariensis TaxID=2747483 RepID=A0A8X6XRI3_9ARAC|nr:hypothetical protein TNIN_181081 [Trichonephila inaurata madagascariensis]
MYTDELLDMLMSITTKQMQSRGNLRREVLLKTTHEVLSKELKEKQQIRKRKWEAMKNDMNKRSRIDTDVEMVDDELIAYHTSCKNICDNHIGLKLSRVMWMKSSVMPEL